MKLLAVLLIGQFMAILDTFVVNVALPEVGVDLHASGAALQLVVGGYIAAYAMLLITGARLGDLYGKRRMYLLGVIVFTLSSLLCGLAPGSVALIVFRFAQGAAAAIMVPQIISTIQLNFTGAARARALSAYGTVLSSGSVVGLAVGGLLVDADLFGLHWRPVFLVNVPIGIVLALLVPRFVPADRPRGSRRLDLPGLAIAAPAVFLVVLPLVLGHELGWPVWSFAAVAAGLLLAVVFVLVERRVADPLLNLEVLRAGGIRAGIITLACMQVALGGLLFVLTLHLQAGLGESALSAGLTYVPMCGIFGLVGFYWRRLPAAIQHLVTPVGMALVAVGDLGISSSPYGGAAFWAGSVIAGVGLGLSASPLLTQSLLHVPPARAADASGLFTTTMQLCQVIGVAVFGTVYLSLRQPGPQGSAAALSTTVLWLALLALAGVVTAVSLARTVLRSARAAELVAVS